MLLDLSALVVVNAALGSASVRLLICKDRVVAAELAGPDMLVHAAVEVIADADINGLFGLGIKYAVFALSGGDLAGVGGVKGLDLGGSAGFVKSHIYHPFNIMRSVK